MYDLRDNYPVDLIYILYDKCLNSKYDEYWMNAVIIKSALISMARQGDSRNDQMKRQKEWKKFLESLDLRGKVEKAKNSKKGSTYLNMFAMAGIPIVDESKKEK